MNNAKTYSVARNTLINAEIPQETSTYKPISHELLMDLTLESIQSAGFELGHEMYSSARNGNIANGRYTIKNVADSEMELQIGWQNSYDKSLSLKFAIGTRILVCSNGAVSGDFGAFRKKHQGTVQEFTPTAITEYIKRAGDVFQQMQRDRESLKQIELTKRTCAELVGRMFVEDQIIESTQVNIIKRELDNPSFDYGAPNSMWELYNHTTLAMKEVHPSLWMKKHMDAHKFFVDASGLLVPNTEIHVPAEGELTQLNLF